MKRCMICSINYMHRFPRADPPDFNWIFIFAVAALGAGVLPLVLTPKLRKWMHGRHRAKARRQKAKHPGKSRVFYF
jgi:hypothetical protein